MGITNWVRNKIFSDDTLDSLVEKLEGRMKVVVLNLLSDEDIAYAVNTYTTALGDYLYERYRKKFTGMLGGIQRGVNYAIEGQTEGGLDIAGILEGGEINISKILASLLLGNLKRPQPQTFASGKIGLEHAK